AADTPRPRYSRRRRARIFPEAAATQRRHSPGRAGDNRTRTAVREASAVASRSRRASRRPPPPRGPDQSAADPGARRETASPAPRRGTRERSPAPPASRWSAGALSMLTNLLKLVRTGAIDRRQHRFDGDLVDAHRLVTAHLRGGVFVGIH